MDSPEVERQVLEISEKFFKVRMEYAHKRGYKGIRKLLPENNPSGGKNYPYFKAMYELFKQVPDIDIYKYISAQFQFSKRELYPKDMMREWAMKSYFKFLRMKPKVNRNVDMELSIKNDDTFVDLYMLNNKYDHTTTLPWEGGIVSVPMWLFLQKRISHFYILRSDALMDELKRLTDKGKYNKENFTKIAILRQSDGFNYDLL